MRRRNFYFVLILGAAMIVLALWWKLGPSGEPAYQGKSLREWVTGMEGYPGMPSPERVAAVRYIGSNNLPWLLEAVSYEPSPTRTRLLQTLNRGLQFLHLRTVEDPDGIRAQCALYTFKYLGSDGAPAAPELIRIMNRPGANDSRERAIIVLGFMGPAGWPTVMSVLTNRNDDDRMCAIAGLRSSGTNAQPAIPMIIECLADTNVFVATRAAYALGEIRAEEDQVLHGLQEGLNDPRPRIRSAVLFALGMHGTNASSALPDILKVAQNDPVRDVRIGATNALRKIAPETTRKGAID